MKKLLLISLVLVGLSANAADELTKDFCNMSQEINGYLMVMSKECHYKLNEPKRLELQQFTKQCNAKFGNKTMFNSLMFGVHDAKQALVESDRNDVCSGIFKAYHNFF